jgi:GTPase|uniref:Tr-type G domain-containing protein n=1 Tax=viral metagenome TaxID=1070528 RepID=A0A6C0IZG8_9ZZZZ
MEQRNPEVEEGNQEYKLKLLDNSIEKVEKITTQMRWRTDEGNGESLYTIGIEDDGSVVGISHEDYIKSIDILTSAADKNNFSITELSKTFVNDDKYLYEVFIRENNKNKHIDVKVAIAGSVDAGKSTLMGSLTSGVNDDGRGLARLSVCNYIHEVKSGRTSSIGQQIIGFNEHGKMINYQGLCGKLSWPEIVNKSSKVINFFDLCGHEKYLKTTIIGLASSEPDLCLIIVSANKGIRNEKGSRASKRGEKKNFDNMTREHIFLCIALNIPFAIVITKIDMVQDQNIKNVYEQTLTEINNIIKCPGVRRQPIKVVTEDDVLISAKQIHTQSIVPIFPISNVTGEGRDNLTSFFNILNKAPRNLIDTNVKMFVDSIWSVPGVGTVVGGHLKSGCIRVNDKLYLGPNNNKYEAVSVRSIHCKKVPVQEVNRGSYVCLALKKIDKKQIRKGNVIISDKNQQLLTCEFSANIKVMKTHSTTIKVGYQPVVHCSAIRAPVVLTKIENKVNSRNPENTTDDEILRTGDTALCTFKLAIRPEFIDKDMKILFAENKTKVIGVVATVK